MLKKAKAEANANAEKKREGASEESKDFAQGILDSSRQIWLAGLGAFSRARGEGLKMFETLVEQGQSLESRTKRAASETAAAAAGVAAQKAKEVQAMAGGTWDKLEQVFEDRVARALTKLGVFTQNDVARLAERVEALAEAVNELIKADRRMPPARPIKAAKPGVGRATQRTAQRNVRARESPEAANAATLSEAKPKVRAPRKSSKTR